MADCVIRKHRKHRCRDPGHRLCTRTATWYAVCPLCHQVLDALSPSTRKIAKDKLYWHVRQHEINGDMPVLVDSPEPSA